MNPCHETHWVFICDPNENVDYDDLFTLHGEREQVFEIVQTICKICEICAGVVVDHPISMDCPEIPRPTTGLQ